MNQTILNIVILQIALILLAFIIVLLVLRQTNAIKLERRFEPFSLLATSGHEKSIFDELLDSIWKFIHKVSGVLEKSAFLTKYAQKYERHITFEEKEFRSGLDYVAMKFLIGFFFSFLNLVTGVFKYSKISLGSFLIMFLIGFFVPDIFLVFEFKKKRKRIEEDLLKAIIIMNNSFKSGRNIMQAIETVKTELDGPIADEFKKIYLDITYGLSLDVVFNRFYERVKLEDAKYIASSLTLLNKTGGNIVRVFASIEKSVFNKKKLRNEMNSLTAASVFVFRVLVALPFVFSFVIYVLNPSYFAPLFTSGIGIFFLLLILVLFSLYVFIIRKVLKVKI